MAGMGFPIKKKQYFLEHLVNPEDIKIPDYTNLKMAKNLYLEAILLHDALVAENLDSKKTIYQNVSCCSTLPQGRS